MIQRVTAERRITVRVEVPSDIQVRSMEYSFVLHTDSDQSQFQLFSTETSETADTDEDGQRHLFPVDATPPREPARPASQRQNSESPNADLLTLFQQHCVPLLALETDQIHDYERAVRHFCDWWREQFCDDGQRDPRLQQPGVATLEKSPHLPGSFYESELKKHSPKTAGDKHMRLIRVWSLLHDAGVIQKAPPKSRKKQIRKRLKIAPGKKRFPIPASMVDIDRWLWACLQLSDELDWPILGDLPPYLFWYNAILASAFHGIRPGDLWAIKPAHKGGLMWSEVCFDACPPINGGDTVSADWEFGWLDLFTNKTGAELVVPMSPHLFFLIQSCRGLHPERVFPIGQSKRSWYQRIDQIKAKADSRQKVDYDVSFCGGQPSRSLRKTSSVLWKQTCNRSAASHMLAHSVRSGRSDDVDEDFSLVTEEHYSGGDIFREIVEAAPAVLNQLPLG